MNWIKPLFDIEPVQFRLSAGRFWLVWGLAVVVNMTSLVWATSLPLKVLHVGVLVFLAIAFFRKSWLQSLMIKLMGIVAVFIQALNLLLLLALFFVVFIPLGFLFRIFGHSPLALKKDVVLASYRIPSEPLDAEHFERPF